MFVLSGDQICACKKEDYRMNFSGMLYISITIVKYIDTISFTFVTKVAVIPFNLLTIKNLDTRTLPVQQSSQGPCHP